MSVNESDRYFFLLGWSVRRKDCRAENVKSFKYNLMCFDAIQTRIFDLKEGEYTRNSEFALGFTDLAKNKIADIVYHNGYFHLGSHTHLKWKLLDRN